MLPPPPRESVDGTDAPRELLVLSPTKIVIRDPIKSAVKKKSVGHCGVQVNLKRRTISREIQTSISGVTSLLEQLDQKNSTPHHTEQTNSVGKLSMPSDQKKPRTDRDHSSSSSKSATHRSDQKSGHVKKEVKDSAHGSSSNHSKQQSASSHSPTSAQLDSRMLSDMEPIPDCLRLAHSHYKKYVHLEKYTNGGALVAHAYQHELQQLSEKEREEFADQFLELVYGESSEGVSHCVMGVVHDAVSVMEDFIDYFTEKHPGLTVKMGVLGKSDIETTTIEKYRENVLKTYSHGTFRWGPLLQISLVGTVHEEVK